jgi:hypothetical protein
MSLALQFATYKIEFSKASISQNNPFLNIYNPVYPNLQLSNHKKPITPFHLYPLYPAQKCKISSRKKEKKIEIRIIPIILPTTLSLPPAPPPRSSSCSSRSARRPPGACTSRRAWLAPPWPRSSTRRSSPSRRRSWPRPPAELPP